MAYDLALAPGERPQALVSDQARRAASARTISAVFIVITLLAGCSTLAMTKSLTLALPQFLAAFGFGWAHWLARSQARVTAAAALTIGVMLAQYCLTSWAATLTQEIVSIAYFTALCPLVAAATLRVRGVVACAVAGVVALALQALSHAGEPEVWRALVAAGYYFAATSVVAVFASLGAERGLRSHVREELRAAHAQAATREAESRYRLVVEHVSDLVSVLDDQGRFVYLSPSHERLLGISLSDALGRAAPELVHPDDYQGMAQAFMKAIEEGSASTLARLDARAGQEPATGDTGYRWFHVRMSRLQEGAEARGSVAVSARDVTEEHRLTEALEGTRRMESLGRLAGGVAHDFNNLLMVIQACADLASQSLPEGHPARPDLDDILRTSERAAALTKQLLTFARRQVLPAGQRAVVSSVVSELAPILERLCGKNIVLSLALADGGIEVKASTVELEQIVVNLTSNAKDAMPSGGTLRIAAVKRRLADGEVAGLGPGDYVELSLEDTGVGMSPQVQARVFEPFFTTKAAGRGTGLGLATVFGLASQLGGSVGVTSQEGRGTTFRVLLPGALAEGALSSAPLLKAAKRALSVLVVDDEEAVRLLIARILETAGHRVTLAENTSSALAAGKQAATPFDLILTDVVLGAEDGLAMLDALRAAHDRASVVVMSGYSPTPRAGRRAGTPGRRVPTQAVRLAAAVGRLGQSPILLGLGKKRPQPGVGAND